MRTKLTFIYGVAINDADYNVTEKVDGNTVICPIYTVWKNMLTRVFSKGYHKKNPQYAEVTLSKDWLSFMEFRKWAVERHFAGAVLDKDLYDPTAKCYSKDTCTFVSQDINQLIHYNERKKVSKLPTGVSHTSSTNKLPYYARLQRYGKYVRLGTFYTVEDAESAYLEGKFHYMMEVAEKQTSARIRSGLKKHLRIVASKYYDVNFMNLDWRWKLHDLLMQRI